MGDTHHPLLVPMVITLIEAVRYSKPDRGAPWVIKTEPGFTPGAVCIPGLCSARAQAPPTPISTYALPAIPDHRDLSLHSRIFPVLQPRNPSIP